MDRKKCTMLMVAEGAAFDEEGPARTLNRRT